MQKMTIKPSLSFRGFSVWVAYQHHHGVHGQSHLSHPSTTWHLLFTPQMEMLLVEPSAKLNLLPTKIVAHSLPQRRKSEPIQHMILWNPYANLSVLNTPTTTTHSAGRSVPLQFSGNRKVGYLTFAIHKRKLSCKLSQPTMVCLQSD